MLCSAQVWGLGLDGKPLIKGSLALLVKLQNQYLYRTIGAYKRTLCIILKCKTAVPPLDLYINIIDMQRVVTVQSHPVEENIHQILKLI